jgi:hypothetical protein
MTLYMISSKGDPLLLIMVGRARRTAVRPYINGSMVRAGWPVCSR